jgi:single-strand DNA-binding protein
MANLNKIMLIGRLTRDPETRAFANGGKVATFGFAVTGQRKKNQQTGEWEEEPCFVDVKAFNRGDPGQPGRKLADLSEQYLHKGDLAYIEGHLVLEKWQDQNTKENRSKLVVHMDDVQFLQPKTDGAPRGGGMNQASRPPAAQGMRKPAPAPTPAYSDGFDESEPQEPQGGPNESDIPF